MVSSCVISNRPNPVDFANKYYAEKYNALQLVLIQNEQNARIHEKIRFVGWIASSQIVSPLLTEMLVSRLCIAYFGEEVVYKQPERFRLNSPPLLAIGLAVLIILVIKIAKNYFILIDCSNQLKELKEIHNRAIAFPAYLKKTEVELKIELRQFRLEIPGNLDNDLHLRCFYLKYNLDKIHSYLNEINELESEIEKINTDPVRQQNEIWDRFLGESGVEKNKQAIEEKNGEIRLLISDCQELVEGGKERIQLGADRERGLGEMLLVKAHISSQITPQFFNKPASIN